MKRAPRHKASTVRINLRISKHQLKQIDQAAKEDSITRSKLIRTAINWYLVPQHRARDQKEEDYIFETIKYRRSLAAHNKLIKDNKNEIDVYDG